MSARYVSSCLISSVRKGAREILVDYVDKTTLWTRPTGFPSASVKEGFVQAVVDNIDTLDLETTRVAMKESAHQSLGDKRMHYTGFQLDKNENVIRVSHYVKDL